MSSIPFDFRAILFEYFYQYILSNQVGPSDLFAVLRFVKFANLESFKDDLFDEEDFCDETDNEAE